MGGLVLGIAFLGGALLLGIGLYLALRGTFPGWWMDWILGPVGHPSPAVARLHGVTAIGLGASIVAIGLTRFVSELVGGLLVLVAIVAYVVGAALFAFSTLLSRRPAS